MHVKTVMLAGLLATVALAGCSVGEQPTRPPQLGTRSSDEDAAEKLGFPSTATKNTIRVGGGDAAADAAGVASAVFPGTNDAVRPTAVVLVDAEDWQAGVTAAVLAAPPIGAPLLVSDGNELPSITSDTLRRLKPKGSDLAKDAQVIRIGDKPPRPTGFKTAVIEGKDPFDRAAAIDRFFSSIKGKPSRDVVVASGEQAAFAMPAAAWAARSGDSVLLTRRNSVPEATVEALKQHSRPNIYLLGPKTVISAKVANELGKLGRVTRVGGPTPVENAIVFTRFERRGFGWGVRVPGYNLSVAGTSRPLDAAASAALATQGVYAPLLLTDRADELPPALEAYLQNIQPGFHQERPARGLITPAQAVYNRVWILGDDKQVSVPAQARLDQITKLIRVETKAP